MAITIKHKVTGETHRCIGLWINAGVKTPRTVYAMPDMNGHSIYELNPCPIVFDRFIIDRGQEWKTYTINKEWMVTE